jgi:microcystin-dependent protein
MATVTGFTAERMLAIENTTIVDGSVVGDNLILSTRAGSEINAGSVRGPTGSPGVTEQQLSTIVANNSPVGSIVDYIGTAAPTGWLSMTGQTVAGGQSTYPLLWVILPASMKSGVDIVMPDTRGRMSVGYNSGDPDFNAIGDTGGAKTHQLTQPELPAAGLVVNPPSTNVAIDPPSTVVAVNPPATVSTDTTAGLHSHGVDLGTGGSGSHNHTVGASHLGFPSGIIVAAQDFPATWGITFGNGVGLPATYVPLTLSTTGVHTHTVAGVTNTANSPNHNHSVDIPSFNINVDIPSFQAAIDLPAFTTGNLGSDSPHNNMPPFITFMKIIKVA